MSIQKVHIIAMSFERFQLNGFTPLTNFYLHSVRKSIKINAFKKLIFDKMFEMMFQHFNVKYKSTFFNNIDITINSKIVTPQSKLSDFVNEQNTTKTMWGDTNIDIGFYNYHNNICYVEYTNSENNKIYYLLMENDSVNDFMKLKSKEGCKDKSIFDENGNKVKLSNKLKDYIVGYGANNNIVKFHYEKVEPIEKKTQPRKKQVQSQSVSGSGGGGSSNDNNIENTDASGNGMGSITEPPKIEYGYIYIIQPREFIKTGENIYKIGRTSRCITKRFTEYPKGSNLMYCSVVDNTCLNEMERKVIESFDTDFKKCVDIGSEYYCGNINEMIHRIHNVIHGKPEAT